ncbi:PREDICTED: agmatine hydroxycinnamoyltransferase 1-like [Nicotiana attenuata]|uniref:Agmatine coumaroyltransferase-2 n=1 Tax=Nicotiana attenuata TaxID=49451 RepID=G9HTF7_NICAT|nr:PREDICTED: agmatine hydroxycinnamoyltransferase 1-like [Nicotiana attenuata]AET80688.1 putrescine hydroxycinnamoyl transferase [Nicotiana attenuata]OIT39750.1 agmatine coumaroyltransferase-2 [Nicotiana attenuata]
MNVKIESSRIIKPFYEGTPPSTNTHISFNVFDNVTYDALMALIYAYRPPTPPTSTIEMGLRKTLAVYREWAGRIGRDENGNRVVFLNDEGVRFIEASVNATLDEVLPLKPSPSLLKLHPGMKDVVELIQVQVTRFTCGSVMVGFTGHHMIADGHAASNFFVAWGQACRGVEITPLPLHDRAIFHPRNPPLIEFNHVGAEFMSKSLNKKEFIKLENTEKNIIVHKVHFTLEFLGKLKANASFMNGKTKTYSTFESLVAHLWRVITKARELDGSQNTQIRISVDGRRRVVPRVADEFFGNIVLWAFPTSKVRDLVNEPLHYATKIIHDAITKVDDKYFKSFIDFANHKVTEDLIPTADMKKDTLCPNLEVDSWLRFPFYDLDFGTGCPFVFMPSYYPTEGMMFLVPSFIGDGSIDAFIPLYQDNSPTFKKICYSLDLKAK